MELKFSNLSLDEILSLYKFNLYYGSSSEHFYSNELVINWAEKQVMQNNDSEILLIIASLGLDKQIDSDEVITYLKRYLAEKNIAIPDINYSSLIVLKLLIQKIISSNNLNDTDFLLSSFVFKYIDLDNKYFHKIKKYWLFIYYDYFARYEEPNCYFPKEQLCEKKQYDKIKFLAKRFYTLLNNKVMVEFLAKHG